MGSDESHFNVSLGVRDSHKTVSTDHNISEDKGEPKRIRTEVPLLTSLTPYCCAYIALHCRHQRDCALRWTAMNAILKTISATTFEEKGQPKQTLFAYQPSVLSLGQSGSQFLRRKVSHNIMLSATVSHVSPFRHAVWW